MQINPSGQLPFKFVKLDSDLPSFEYDVYLYGVKLGTVYRDDMAWSYARWFIGGVPQEITAGGVNQLTQKARGYGTRYLAARALAISKSAKLLAAQEA